jgi:hypothetical protein
MEEIAEIIRREIDKLPKPKDGIDGVDGKDVDMDRSRRLSKERSVKSRHPRMGKTVSASMIWM